MSQYNWDSKKIENSQISNYKKDILLSEKNGFISKDDPSKTLKKSLLEFKKHNLDCIHTLNTLFPDIIKFTSTLYQDYDIRKLSKYQLPKIEVSDESLINSVRELLEYLGDEELMNTYQFIANKNNHIIRIAENNQDNPITNYVYGRCIKTNEGLTLMSFYKKNDFKDYQTFSHEVGHTIIDYLFKNNVNPLFNVLFRETEAFYFELLMIYFLSIKTKEGIISKYLDANLTAKIVDYFWHIRIQEIISRQPGFILRYKKINKDSISSDGMELSKDEIDYVMSISPLMYYNIINSFLLALDLVKMTINDKEKGLYSFKNILTDKETLIKELFRKYEITYLTTGENLNDAYQKALSLKLEN